MKQSGQEEQQWHRLSEQVPEGREDLVWEQIQQRLRQPEQQAVPFRKLQLLMAVAIILTLINIWAWSAVQHSAAETPATPSYNLNIY